MNKKIFLTLSGGLLISLGNAASVHAQSLSLPPGGYMAAQILQQWGQAWPWYITRASGLVAAVLLFVLLASGVGLITGYTYRLLEPIVAWATHRAIGIAFGISVVVHIFALLFDKFIPFNLVQLFVPFASSYKPVTLGGLHLGSFWVALGVLAFYGVIAVVVTSLIWVEKKPHTWRVFHYASYFIAAAVFIHALGLGSDLKGGPGRVLWIAGGLATLVFVGLRLWRARTIEGGKRW